MNFKEYQELAMRTRNTTLTEIEHLTNGALGLNGEAGEVADVVKKHLMQGHMLDTEHIVKELGDCLWYIAEAATALGVSMDQIAEKNIEKLKKRYPQGFDTANSQHRSEGDI